eukprot:1099700-Karenia_brevis.AAC.1
MLSSGGAGNGSIWLSLPRFEGEWMPDAHFIIASACRLGRLKAPDGAACQLLSRDGDTCGASLAHGLKH